MANCPFCRQHASFSDTGVQFTPPAVLLPNEDLFYLRDRASPACAPIQTDTLLSSAPAGMGKGSRAIPVERLQRMLDRGYFDQIRARHHGVLLTAKNSGKRPNFEQINAVPPSIHQSISIHHPRMRALKPTMMPQQHGLSALSAG